MTIKQLPAVREKFISSSDSLFEFKVDDPRTLHYEPLVFLGDSMYWIILESLAQENEGVNEGMNQGVNAAIILEKPSQKIVEWKVSLTEFGEALLAGNAHWIQSNGYDRWFGGTHNTSDQSCWYWDEENQDVILK